MSKSYFRQIRQAHAPASASKPKEVPSTTKKTVSINPMLSYSKVLKRSREYGDDDEEVILQPISPNLRSIAQPELSRHYGQAKKLKVTPKPAQSPPTIVSKPRTNGYSLSGAGGMRNASCSGSRPQLTPSRSLPALRPSPGSSGSRPPPPTQHRTRSTTGRCRRARQTTSTRPRPDRRRDRPAGSRNRQSRPGCQQRDHHHRQRQAHPHNPHRRRPGPLPEMPRTRSAEDSAVHQGTPQGGEGTCHGGQAARR